MKYGLKISFILIALILLGLSCGLSPRRAGQKPVSFLPEVPEVALLEEDIVATTAENKVVIIDQVTVQKPQVGVVSASRISVLPVPFTPQAPRANWTMPYQEACEEASIIMVVEYLADRKNLQIPAEEADRLILELIDWQEQNGYAVDLTAQEVSQILKDRYDISSQVVPFNAQIIREEIKARRPVIIPAAGRLLDNPYFTRPGPLYHMLVIKGFEGDEFITNDPGTKRGESYRYTETILSTAVRDWNTGDVYNGLPVMIILQAD